MTKHDAIDDLCEHLSAEADERIFHTGGQLYVSMSGVPIVDIAVGVDGVGQHVQRNTLFALYCAGKPVVATAIGCLLDDGELSLDDKVGDAVDRPLPDALTRLKIQDLLNHTAGLHLVNARDYLICSERQRDSLIASSPQGSGWRTGLDVAYSEVAAWHVLGWVIETVSGETTRAFLQRRVLDSLAVHDELFVAGLDDQVYTARRDSLGVNVWLAGTTGDPLLIERTRRFRCTPSPALGTSGSARGLGRFYEGLQRIRGSTGELHALGPALSPVSKDTLACLTLRASHGFDPVMGRACSYGYGFMTNLAEHCFGRRCSTYAFGHSGNGGMTAALCDPECDLVIAFHFNGRVDAESAVMYRRPALIDKIYSAVIGDDKALGR